MSGKSKNWAEQESSDEGSLVDEDKAPEISGSVQSGYAVLPPQPPQQSRHHKAGTTRGPHSIDVESLVAFVSYIDIAASRSEVGEFFEENGCSINRLELCPPNQRKVHERKEPKQSAMIEFKDRKSMETCLRLSGARLKGGSIRTAVFRPTANRFAPMPTSVQRRGNETAAVDKGYRSERSDGRTANRSGSLRESKSAADERRAAAPVATPPGERPRIIVQPRTLPMEDVGKKVVADPSIFGGGRARVEGNCTESQKDALRDSSAVTNDAIVEGERSADNAGRSVTKASQKGVASRGQHRQKGRGGGRSGRDKSSGRSYDSINLANRDELSHPDSTSSSALDANTGSLVVTEPAQDAVEESTGNVVQKDSTGFRSKRKERGRDGQLHEGGAHIGQGGTEAHELSASNLGDDDYQASSGKGKGGSKTTNSNNNGRNNNRIQQNNNSNSRDDGSRDGSGISRKPHGNGGGRRGGGSTGELDSSKGTRSLFGVAVKQTNLMQGNISAGKKGTGTTASRGRAEDGTTAADKRSANAAEKFERAQVHLQAKEKNTSKSGTGLPQKPTSFSVLVDEDDDSD